MGGLVAKLGRTLIVLGLVIVLVGCGWVLALVVHSGTNVGLWSLAPALFVIGMGLGCCYSTIFDVALVTSTRRGRQRQRLTELHPATRGRNRIGRGHLGILPSRDLGLAHA